MLDDLLRRGLLYADHADRYGYVDVHDSRNLFRIDAVRTAKGCPEGCAHCGAYPAGSLGCRPSEVSLASLRYFLNLSVGIPKYSRDGRDVFLRELLANYVTTDVNSEPTSVDNFPGFARLINDVSERRSQVVAITHGAHARNARAIQRLADIVQLMKEGVIPLAVVSMDVLRNARRIMPEHNFDSYLATLEIMKQALPERFVTVSLQFDTKRDERAVLKLWDNLWPRLWTRDEMDDLSTAYGSTGGLNVDYRMGYTVSGRSEKKHKHYFDTGDTLIPDSNFVEDFIDRDVPYRGMIVFLRDLDGVEKGVLLAQWNNIRNGYGDTVDPKKWWRLILPSDVTSSDGTPGTPIPSGGIDVQGRGAVSLIGRSCAMAPIGVPPGLLPQGGIPFMSSMNAATALLGSALHV